MAARTIKYVSDDPHNPLSNVNNNIDIIMFTTQDSIRGFTYGVSSILPTELQILRDSHKINSNNTEVSRGKWGDACVWARDLLHHASFPFHCHKYHEMAIQADQGGDKFRALQSVIAVFQYVAHDISDTVSDRVPSDGLYFPANISFLSRVQQSSLGWYTPGS